MTNTIIAKRHAGLILFQFSMPLSTKEHANMITTT